jgi:predicted SPOUT superfamily RNA methylase MTH1
MKMQPLKRIPYLAIAIPASLVSNTPHLREKSIKIGLIGRAAAIFKVEEILIYPDQPNRDQSRDSQFIYTILTYLETPQYLRRLLYPIHKSLRYSGVLPPLRTPHHSPSKHVRELKPGQFREGVVVRTNETKSLVDIGVEQPALLKRIQLPVKTRITTKIVAVTKGIPEITLAKKEEINIYWGYSVTVSNLSLGRAIKRGTYDLTIMTSRHGKPITHVIGKIKKRWTRARKVLMTFGSPNQGLQEILQREKTQIYDVADVVVNTIPEQGSDTVRTEEAIYASLSLINVITLM